MGRSPVQQQRNAPRQLTAAFVLALGQARRPGQQLAQAITIFRAGQAAESVKAASDLTNELLRENAKNLRQVNAEVRTQMERGVFDIDTVRLANDELIATIEDSLRIADEGKKKRAEAEKQLVECETRLRETLVAASARAQAPMPGRGAPAAG